MLDGLAAKIGQNQEHLVRRVSVRRREVLSQSGGEEVRPPRGGTSVVEEPCTTLTLKQWDGILAEEAEMAHSYVKRQQPVRFQGGRLRNSISTKCRILPSYCVIRAEINVTYGVDVSPFEGCEGTASILASNTARFCLATDRTSAKWMVWLSNPSSAFAATRS